MSTVRLGTRGSPLALAQSRHVAALLEKTRPGLRVELQVIRTEGDRNTTSPLEEIGGKGIFVREIEQALLAGTIDLAVHSLKDLPAEQPEGLVLAGFPRREDPRDVLITRDGLDLDELPAGARVATGSVRRRSQIHAHRSDILFVASRGNVGTRVGRLEQGQVDALVLAAAGIRRLGLAEKIRYVPIDEEICIPSAGQGIIGLEIRQDDAERHEDVRAVSDPVAVVEACAERGFLRELAGSCFIPAAGLARFDGRRVRMRARILSLDGARRAEAEVEGPPADARHIGVEAARLCLARGGAEILAQLGEGGGGQARA